MSFVGKLLASFGIGAAKVDARMHKNRLVPGETVEGTVCIKGGNLEQNVDRIYLSVNTTYERDHDEGKVTTHFEIGRFPLTQSLVIRPDETREIPYSFELPADTPITAGSTKVSVQAELDIKHALDPIDEDEILIVPTPPVAAVLGALEELGFKLQNADCVESDGIFRNRLPFVQEFEYEPVDGPFKGKLKTLEVVFVHTLHGTEVWMEADRRARGFASKLAESTELNEHLFRFTVAEQDIPNITGLVRTAVERNANKE